MAKVGKTIQASQGVFTPEQSPGHGIIRGRKALKQSPNISDRMGTRCPCKSKNRTLGPFRDPCCCPKFTSQLERRKQKPRQVGDKKKGPQMVQTR